VSEAGGAKSVRVAVAASAVAEDGKEAGWTEQALSVPVEADGSFVAGFKLALRPGKYTLKAGAVDEKNAKGSVVTQPIDVPDLSKVETAADGTSSKLPSAGSLIIVGAWRSCPAAPPTRATRCTPSSSASCGWCRPSAGWPRRASRSSSSTRSTT
jgi:hypothetical protein